VPLAQCKNAPVGCIRRGRFFGVESGEWRVDGGGWTVDGGRWRVDGGRWTVKGGRWTVDGGRWTVVDGGRWTVERGEWRVARPESGLQVRVELVDGRWEFARKGRKESVERAMRSRQRSSLLWITGTDESGRSSLSFHASPPKSSNPPILQSSHHPFFNASTVHPPLSTLHSPPSTLHSPLSTLYSPPSTLYSPHSKLPLRRRRGHAGIGKEQRSAGAHLDAGKQP
jgi:hypothetical protein